MGKRTTGKKRGIQRGVAKHKIKSKALSARGSDRTFLGVGEQFYFSLARKCFEFWLYCCNKLHLASFTRNESGEYVLLDQKSQFIHYCVWSIKFVMLLHKTVGLVIILLREELNIKTFMCTSLFLIYFVSFCISFGMLARPKETIDVLNSCPLMLSCLKEFREDELSMFDNLSAALKIISVLIATQGIAIAAALLSLAFSTLPNCYFPTAEAFGLIPEGVLPRFAWQLIFFPLEYMTYLPPMYSAPLAGSVLLILVGVVKTVGSELR